jgi:hypothetical protein
MNSFRLVDSAGGKRVLDSVALASNRTPSEKQATLLASRRERRV